MKIQFRLQLNSSGHYRDIIFLRKEIEGKKRGLRYIRKEKVRAREKHIRNLETLLNKLLSKKL